MKMDGRRSLRFPLIFSLRKVTYATFKCWLRKLVKYVMKLFNFITYFHQYTQLINQIAYVTFRREKSMGSARPRLPSIFLPSGAAAYFPFFWSGVPFKKTHHTTSCWGFLCGYEAHHNCTNDSIKSFAIFPSKKVPRGLNPTFSLDANLCPFLFPFYYEMFILIVNTLAFTFVFYICISFFPCPIQLAFHSSEILFNI